MVSKSWQFYGKPVIVHGIATVVIPWDSIECPLRVMSWLYVKLNYFEIILKLFQGFISHVTSVGGYV